MVASTAPAEAHTYAKVGTAYATEARKLFKETFKQKCLTVHEARHIVHGSGTLAGPYENEGDPYRDLYVAGTKKSHVSLIRLSVDLDTGCAFEISAVKR